MPLSGWSSQDYKLTEKYGGKIKAAECISNMKTVITNVRGFVWQAKLIWSIYMKQKTINLSMHGPHEHIISKTQAN